ncbi:MAG TPA: inorganic diphosphatase [Opitutaceae bacterium]|nr:inorganic diphosphatase [Opitutaceae bacterium]
MQLDSIPAFNHGADRGTVNVVVETPKGSRHKYKYQPTLQAMTLDKVLPQGHVFPFDFGFIPETLCEDGDPLDVLVLLDDAVFPGCVVKCRLVGAIEATQTVDRRTFRNDRLVATPVRSVDFAEVRQLRDLNPGLRGQIRQFFVSYNAAQGRRFRPLREVGAEAARKLLEAAIRTKAGS